MNFLTTLLGIFNALNSEAPVVNAIVGQGFALANTLTTNPAHQTFLQTLEQKFAEDEVFALQAVRSLGVVVQTAGATLTALKPVTVAMTTSGKSMQPIAEITTTQTATTEGVASSTSPLDEQSSA